MAKNNKNIRIIKEFVRQRLLLESVYQPINFYDDVYEVASNKPSMNKEKLVQKILNLKDEVLPSISNKKERKKVILDFSKSIRKESGFDVRNLTIYLKPILSFIKASGDTNLEECLRVANLFNDKLLKRVNEDFREKVKSQTITFDNIIKLTYYYEQNILPVVKKSKSNISIEEMVKKYNKYVIENNNNYLAIHPTNATDFAEIVRILIKDLDDPNYPSVTWCTQNPGSWEEHNSSEHIIILYNKNLHYSDRNKFADEHDEELEDPNYLYKYSMISLKVYKNHEDYVQDPDEVFEEIAYESSVNIDNEHVITEKGLREAIPNFDAFESKLIKYCQNVVDEKPKEINIEDITQSLDFFAEHNMFDKSMSFFESNIQKRTPLASLKIYIENILNYSKINVSKKEFCFKLATELFVNVAYKKAIQHNPMKWLMKDFRQCKETLPEFIDYFFDYCLSKYQSDSRGIYAYALAFYFGTNYDSQMNSPSGFSKSKILPHYKSIVKKIDSGSLEPLFVNFCENYEIAGGMSFSNSFYFVDDKDINLKIVNTKLLFYMFNNTKKVNLLDLFKQGTAFYLFYLSDSLDKILKKETIDEVAATFNEDSSYNMFKSKYAEMLRGKSITNTVYGTEAFFSEAYNKIKNLNSKTKTVHGIEYNKDDILF